MVDSDKDKRAFLLHYSTEAQSFIHRGEKNEALKCYDIILTRYPESQSAFYGKGMTHFEFNELEKALQCFDKALSLNDSDIDSLYAKGSILSSLGKNVDALEHFDKILAINDKMGITLLAKGYALLGLNNPEKALEYFEKAALYGKGFTVLNGKGHALRKLHKLKEAKTCYLAAYKQDPYDSEALFGLGAIEFELKNLKKAQDFLYKSVVQDEENVDAWIILAEIFKLTKQVDKEKVALEMIDKLKKPI